MTADQIKRLTDSGIYFAADVNPDKIADSAVIFPGCRISGAHTSIGPHCTIGSESPVTLDTCQLDRKVSLKGGYFSGAVFFDGSNMGSGAHVRAGTILEEESGGAHTVGMKQTVFMPFVTAGSLINFCDALMSGGTSRTDHSEIGSSYIHFNYTPHQDKATASLAGDVPNGVFMDQKPIFLGGQGGLVGPSRIAFGSVIAAGGICRQDIEHRRKLLIPATPAPGERDYETGVYRNIDRITINCMAYIGNIAALREWYKQVRTKFIRDSFSAAVLEGAINNLDLIVQERIKRLGQLADHMEYSVRFLANNSGKPEEIKMQNQLASNWPEMKSAIEKMTPEKAPEAFLQSLSTNQPYLEAVQSISSEQRKLGWRWLQTIVNDFTTIWSNI